MRIAQISAFAFTLTLLVSNTGAQTDWQKYTVKNEQFSVALPSPPAVDLKWREDSSGERKELTLSRFADGVLYLIHVVENPRPKKSLSSFMKDRSLSARQVNRKTEREVTVDGVTGKAFSFTGIDGGVQYFSKDDRLYQFATFGAPLDDERVTRFFSSISLANKKDAVELVYKAPSWPGSPSTSSAPEQIFSAKEVDKSFQPVLNPLPDYTSMARENQIKGTVVLECTLTADGYVKNIRLVSGLPYGLTERAVAAASGFKFIPAMKNGKYVSVAARLVYNFEIY